MRLYSRCCEKCKKKVYFNIVFNSREHLRGYFNSDAINLLCSNCNTINIKNTSEVHAEPSGRTVFFGLASGFFMGIFVVTCTYDNWWLVYGPVIGGLTGFIIDSKQRAAAAFFNNS